MGQRLSMGEAAERLGIDRRRLRLLIARYDIETTEDPLDFRKRIIAEEDVEKLAQLIGEPKKEAA